MDDEKLYSAFFSEALLLAGATVLVYGTAYAREYGYFQSLRIPHELLLVTPGTVFYAAAATAFAIALFLVLSYATSEQINRCNTLWLRELLRTAFVVSLPLLWCGLSGGYFIVVLVVAPLVYTQFLLSSYAERKTGRRREKDRVGQIAFVALYCILVANVLGSTESLNRSEYLVSIAEPDLVVLRKYDDTLVLAKFDRATKKLKREFRVMKLAESSVVDAAAFRYEKVGPLERAPNLTP